MKLCVTHRTVAYHTQPTPLSLMTKPDGLAPDTNDHVSPAAWGTWEELLLAFAVNRHGTAAWDSISSELQKRTSDPNLCLTAHGCRSKYLDLKRRFVITNDKSNADESAPLLDELRKLRVAELRREVQRYDLNIEYSFTISAYTIESIVERSQRRGKFFVSTRRGDFRVS